MLFVCLKKCVFCLFFIMLRPIFLCKLCPLLAVIIEDIAIFQIHLLLQRNENYEVTVCMRQSDTLECMKCCHLTVNFAIGKQVVLSAQLIYLTIIAS